jgi:transposase-like protein
MAKANPKEFRDDVVAVARQGQAPLSQIAKDFGISEGSLSNWLKKADIEESHRPHPRHRGGARTAGHYRLTPRRITRHTPLDGT